MRRRALLAATALVATLVTTALPDAPTADAAGTPPACAWSNSSQRYCNRYTTTGAMGSIGLLGDSVLLGSADGASTPGLPSMLSAKGWGPINLVATLGMRTKYAADGNISAVYQLQRWHNAGFHPDVIAINLGANHLGYWNSPTCTETSYSYCRTSILQVMDEIALSHPTAKVWWSRVNFQPFGGGPGVAMLGWNKALDEIAAERPNLVVWDWPTALATANPAISMDQHRIHPVSGTQYVKRSTLMATHITDQMGAARFTGPRVTLPPTVGQRLGYQSINPATAYVSLGTLGAATTTEIDLSTLIPEGTDAVDGFFSASGSSTLGYLTAFPCGETQPVVSSLNYSAGTSRVAHAIVRVSADRKVCVYNSTPVQMRFSVEGVFDENAPLGFTPIAPQRPLDTRNTGKSDTLTVTVPSAEAVAVTITVTGASSGGFVALQRCDTPDAPDALVYALGYQPNEVVAGAAFAAEWVDGNVCLKVTPNAPGDLPHVILDVTGTFDDGTGLVFRPVQATRLLDTRIALGGWVGRHGSGQTIDVVATPTDAQAVTGTITMVKPMFQGWLTAYACGQSLPPTSAVNARGGIVMANSLTVGVNSTNGTMCIRASHSTNSLFDVVGWWVVRPAG